MQNRSYDDQFSINQNYHPVIIKMIFKFAQKILDAVN